MCYPIIICKITKIQRDEREGPDAQGNYKFLYETGNGINVEEEGFVKNAGTEDEAHVSWWERINVIYQTMHN